MLNTIKTSYQNKENVSNLTYRLGLGAENTIARLAIGYSLSLDRYMNLSEIQDSKGKEYSSRVLLGDQADLYVALICVQYNITKSDKDISKYLKMHLDDGLNLIKSEFDKKTSLSGTDFVINKIESGLKSII